MRGLVVRSVQASILALRYLMCNTSAVARCLSSDGNGRHVYRLAHNEAIHRAWRVGGSDALGNGRYTPGRHV